MNKTVLWDVFLLFFFFYFGYIIKGMKIDDKITEVDQKIGMEMEKYPVTYQNHTNFGINLGLVKCSSLVREVNK